MWLCCLIHSPFHVHYVEYNTGVLPVSERPDFDAENGGFLDVEETEEEMEVELNDEEPAFLAGQTQFSRCVLCLVWLWGVGS